MKKKEYYDADALGTAKFFINANKNEEAKQALDMIKPYCQNMAQIDAIGKLYAEIREFNDTLELAQRANAIAQTNEEKFICRTNIVRAYLNLNEPEKALTYIKIQEKIDPKDHPNQMDKAMCFFLLNRKPEGEAILRKILTEPRTKDIDYRVNFNLGTYDLANGKFKDGLKHVLLDGRKLNIWHTYDLPIEQQWEGGTQPGKTIMMCAEGGMGDEIISVRFQKQFKDAGMNPVWYTNRRDMASIFKRSGFSVITDIRDFQKDWLWCYAMPSPTYLDLNEDQLWYGPYIKPLERLNLGPKKKLRIGFKCMGNPKYDQDLHRTIPYKEVLDCLPQDAEIYSFHIEEDIPDDRLIPLKNKINDWEDTLSLLSQMDVVMSSCTSLAHAAGAMDIETVVMVPILNYYTWAYPTRHSKWYSDKVTILRQQEYNNWNAPLKELEEYFGQRV